MSQTLHQLTQFERPGVEPDFEVVARATQLVPLIRENAEESSRQRRVVPAVITALEDADLFELMVPKRLGGHGTNMRTLVETIAEVARGDGSTGWAFALMSNCPWILSTFGEAAQAEIFSTPKLKAWNVLGQAQQAQRVDGGYVISGRWPYASGSFAAEWGSFGIPLEDGGHGLAAAPRTAWSIEPSWFVTGLQGSGSDTVVIENEFVPDHRIQRVTDLIEGIYATPHTDEQHAHMAYLPSNGLPLVAVQVGLARHALEVTLSRLPNKRVAYTIYSHARNSPTHQIAVAEAASRFDQAELLLQRSAETIDAAAAQGTMLTVLERGRVIMDIGMISELVREGVDRLMTANGSSAFAEADVLSRIWRDAELALRHVLMAPELAKEVYGQLLLGADGPLNKLL